VHADHGDFFGYAHAAPLRLADHLHRQAVEQANDRLVLAACLQPTRLQSGQYAPRRHLHCQMGAKSAAFGERLHISLKASRHPGMWRRRGQKDDALASVCVNEKRDRRGHPA